MSDPAKLDVRSAGRQASHQFSTGEKIAGALADLRLRFFPRPVLVAGPYVGEFGHELMDWQPWVRAQIARHREVHVITYPGRDLLYPGCHVHYHDVPLEKAGYRFGRLSPRQLADMAREKAASLGLKNYDLMTALHICTSYHRRFLLPAKFERLGQPPAAEKIRDVAFHFRRVKKDGPDQTRNYPPELCDRVVAACRAAGLSFFCVGHPRYAYCPEDVEDRRSEDLAASVAAVNSARLLAGELSGPMHLAQLCGVPILIWADGQWRLDDCAHWNVFRVPTYIVANDTFQPEPERVAQKIHAALADLRQRTDDFRQPACTPPK
jgi:hypothetical protein